MNGLTPTTPGSQISGLQDVLAFIADFEMDNADEETKTSPTESGSVGNEALEELFADGGRPATMTSTAMTPAHFTAVDTNATLLSSLKTFEQQTLAGLSIGTLGGGNEPTKAPRRHRVSRKEELEYLRKKVIDMEDKLQQLKNHAESKQSPSPSDAPSSPETPGAALKLEQSIALWKTMAERQKNQREVVESENAKLREKLKTQVRMAKSLQRILHKRERTAEQITEGTSKRMRLLEEGVCSAGSTDPFEELAQGLSALYMRSDERVSTCPIVSASQPAIREQDVKYDDISGMYLEFRNSKLLPFGLMATSRAVWRFTSETGIKYNAYFEEAAETREDMVLRKFGVEIKLDDRSAKMSGRQAIRRFAEDRRVLIVRNSAIDRVELSDASTGGVTFREAGWMVLKDVSDQFTGLGSMTLFQSCSTLTPDIDLDSQWEIGALTDFVLQSRGDIEVGNDSILENLLLEETTKRK